MPPADCTHILYREGTLYIFLLELFAYLVILDRKRISVLVLKYTCLAIVCDICEVGGHVHLYVCMCEEMFVSRTNYNISLFPFFIY